MTISVKHTKNSGVADSANSQIVQPSDWNAEHTYTMATGKLVGRTTASAGAFEEITANVNHLTLANKVLSVNTALITVNQTSASGNYYPVFANGTSGFITHNISNLKFKLNLPSGQLTADGGFFASNGNIIIAAPSGTARVLALSGPSSNARWQLRKNATAESGSNVGSDFEIACYADNGATLLTPLSITRSTGKVNFLPSTTTSAGIYLGQGVAPTTPVNGDIWTTSSSLYAYVGSTTYDLARPSSVNIANQTNNATYYPVFATGTNILSTLNGTSGSYTFNPSTGTLSATVFSGSFTGSAINMFSASGTAAQMSFKTGTSFRWEIGKSSVSESGSNAGSNFVINRYDDTGTYVDTPFFITRSSGIISMNAFFVPNGYYSAASGTSAYTTFQTGGSTRWDAGRSGTAESGGGVGSNYAINRYNDSGVYRDTPFIIARVDGSITYSNTQILAASTTAAASLRMPQGTAPTTPTNGDMWLSSATGLGFRVAGVTRTVSLLEGAQTYSAVKTFSAIPILSGGAISFPATQVASAGANDLDDYEEGTFTPTFSATGCTFSYATQTGNYTKIGRLVAFEISITLNTTGNTLAANPLSFAGLPFTAASTVNSRCLVSWNNATSSYVFAQGNVSPSATTGGIFGMTAAATGSSQTTNASAFLNATTGCNVRITGVYYV